VPRWLDRGQQVALAWIAGMVCCAVWRQCCCHGCVQCCLERRPRHTPTCKHPHPAPALQPARPCSPSPTSCSQGPTTAPWPATTPMCCGGSLERHSQDPGSMHPPVMQLWETQSCQCCLRPTLPAARLHAWGECGKVGWEAVHVCAGGHGAAPPVWMQLHALPTLVASNCTVPALPPQPSTDMHGP